MHAQFLKRARDLEARRALLDHEQVEAAVATFPIAFRHDQGPVAARSVGDEDLAAVHNEVVALAPRDGRDRRHVRAGVRFCDRQGGDLLAADRRRQPLALLLLGPELEYRRRGHFGLDRDRHPEPAASDPGHLLGEDDGREVVPALPSVLGRIPETEKAELPEPPEDRVWEGLLLPLLEVGLDLLVEEPSDVQPELLVGVGEVHRAWSLGSNGRRAAYGMIPGPRAGRVSPFRKSIVSGSWIGLGHQEAAQEDAQAQAQEDA